MSWGLQFVENKVMGCDCMRFGR